MRKFIGCMFLLLLTLTSYADAQTCDDNLIDIKKALATTRDPGFVLRAAAVGGIAFLPLLKTMSKPDQPRWAIPGAAQVALARLGDEGALDEIRGQLAKDPDAAIDKLVMIRTESSFSVLMHYLIENKNNPSRIKDAGDYLDDPFNPAIRGMIDMLEAPPYLRANPGQADGWQKWWEGSNAPHITSISESVSDPVSRCWARLAEWGNVDGVYQLYTRMGKDSIPLLRRFATLGDKSYPTSTFKTVRGAAQTLLAREGDQEQLEKIVHELDDALYPDAISKLQYIDLSESFDALLRSLSLMNFMPKVARDTNRAYLDAEGKKLRVAVMSALSNMVTHPPLPPEAPPTPENMQKWSTWWAANKGRGALKDLPR